MAQERAFKKKKNVEVIWRGYKDIVKPTGPLFTIDDLRGRLFLALRQILRNNGTDSYPEKEETVYQSLSQEIGSSFPPLPSIKKAKKKKTSNLTVFEVHIFY